MNMQKPLISALVKLVRMAAAREERHIVELVSAWSQLKNSCEQERPPELEVCTSRTCGGKGTPAYWSRLGVWVAGCEFLVRRETVFTNSNYSN